MVQSTLFVYYCYGVLMNEDRIELLLVDLADYLVKLKLQKSGLVPFSGNNDFDLALKIEKQNFLTRSKRQAQQQRLWLGQAEELKLRISRLLTRKVILYIFIGIEKIGVFTLLLLLLLFFLLLFLFFLFAANTGNSSL